jgi:hypothetical protein
MIHCVGRRTWGLTNGQSATEFLHSNKRSYDSEPKESSQSQTRCLRRLSLPPLLQPFDRAKCIREMLSKGPFVFLTKIRICNLKRISVLYKLASSLSLLLLFTDGMDSSVGIVYRPPAGRPRNLALIRGRGNGFFSCPICPEWLPCSTYLL